MSTVTITLPEFLLARIGEDEQRARDLQAAYDRDEVRPPGRLVNLFALVVPREVLAECEAKRRIVEMHAVTVERQWVNPADGPAYEESEHTCAICGWVPDACDTVKRLAEVYSEHPDFREEWKP